MKLIKIIFILFVTTFICNKVKSNESLIQSLKEGDKLIFIRHAYAPGNGDPENFIISKCSTQRNLDYRGIKQSKKIGSFFKDNSINIDKVISSQWCRCKNTARIAFKNYKTKSFLNSFYSSKFAKNKDNQIKNLKSYVDNLNNNENIVFVTHYVVISEALSYSPSSGEIVIADKKFNIIGTIKIDY